MTISPVGVGTTPNDGTGDSLRSLAQTVNLIIAALGGVGTANPVVEYATAAALAANTYSAGVLTASANGALTVDGTAVAVTDRILVKDEVSQLKNGVYVVTATGSAGAPYVLTRADDYSTWDALAGTVIFVQKGTANDETAWQSTADAGGTVGTTAVAYVQVSSGTISAAQWGYLAGAVAFGGSLLAASNLAALVTAMGGASAVQAAIIGNSLLVGGGGVGTIELGSVADCSLSRAAAGTLAVEGVNVLTTATGAQLSATNVFSGAYNRFGDGSANGGIQIYSQFPYLDWYDSNAGADEKIWRSYAQANVWEIGAYSDSSGTYNAALTIVRSGAGISYLSMNAPLRMPAGSAAAPALCGSADTNTGYTFDGSDILGIVTGGTKRFTISTTGLLDEANGGMTIGGNGSKRVGDIHLASGKKVTFNSGNAGATSITHSSGVMTLAGDLVLDATATPSAASAGFRGLGVPSVKTADYTFVITDAGQMVRLNSASSRNFTIPTFASVAFPNGTLIPVSNYGAGTCVILAPSGGTLYDEDGTSGSVTLNQHHGGVLERDADSGTNVWRYRGQHA